MVVPTSAIWKVSRSALPICGRRVRSGGIICPRMRPMLGMPSISLTGEIPTAENACTTTASAIAPARKVTTEGLSNRSGLWSGLAMASAVDEG